MVTLKFTTQLSTSTMWTRSHIGELQRTVRTVSRAPDQAGNTRTRIHARKNVGTPARRIHVIKCQKSRHDHRETVTIGARYRCQIQMPEQYQRRCQVECQRECQSKCQIECKNVCQTNVRIHARNNCQIKYKQKMPDRMPENIRTNVRIHATKNARESR